MTKVCTKCKIEKTLDNYSKSKKHKSGIQYYCKECSAKINKEYLPTRWRDFHLKKNYGISENKYKELLIHQNNKCAICRENKLETLCVDHDHISNKIRGLLCRNCNWAIGLLRDSRENCLRAFEYLNDTTTPIVT